MTRLRSALFAFVLVACGGSAQSSQPVCPLASAPPQTASPAPPNDGLDALTEEQLVRRVLEVTGAQALGKQVADSVLDTFAKSPNIRPGFIERLKQNMKAEELVELLVPLYLQHYDKKTLVAILRFYATDAGRAVLATTPILTKEAMEVGKRWAAEVAKKTFKELPP